VRAPLLRSKGDRHAFAKMQINLTMTLKALTVGL
jgi:hypothetical protein